MQTSKLIRLALLATIATLGLAGCGDEDEPDAPPALEQLGRYLPADAPVITFVDLAQAREQLELPADADALDFEVLKGSDVSDPTPEVQLLEAAILGMPSLTSFAQTLEEDPASAEFDGSQITAAVNTIGDGYPMTLIVTSQPFEEIADGLTALGWRTEGDVVIKEGERFEQVADGGDGVVIIGRNEIAADVLADEPGGPTELFELLAPADQPVQAAAAGNPSDDCLAAVGGWENAALTEGVVRFGLADDQQADAEAIVTDELEEGLSFDTGEPTVDGAYGEIPFTAPEDGPPGSRIRAFLTRFASIYEC